MTFRNTVSALALLALASGSAAAQSAGLAFASAPTGGPVALAPNYAADHATTVERPTATERPAAATQLRKVKRLELQRGYYEFDIANVSVDDALGFVIQRVNAPDADMRTTVIPNGATKTLVARGESARTGEVRLRPGRYIVSASMDTQPYYVIDVR